MNQSYSILRIRSLQPSHKSNSKQEIETEGRKRASSYSLLSKIFGKQTNQRSLTSFNDNSYEKSTFDLNYQATSYSESIQLPKPRAASMTESPERSPDISKGRPTRSGFLINKQAKLGQTLNSFNSTKPKSVTTQTFQTSSVFNKTIMNEKIALSKLLQDMPVKKILRVQSSQKKNLLPFEKQPSNKTATTQSVNSTSRETSPQRIKTETASPETSHYEKTREEDFFRLKTEHNFSVGTKPLAKRGKTDSCVLRYSKSKPSILDYLTNDDGKNQTQDNRLPFALNKSYSRIQQVKAQPRQELKSQTDYQQIKTIEPRRTRRKGDEFMKLIQSMEKGPKLTDDRINQPYEIGKKFQENEDGIDAEDLAADDLAKVLAQYPFDRTMLRLNRQITIGFKYHTTKKMMPRPENTKANYARIRKKLKEVLNKIKNLQLTIDEVRPILL